MHNFSKSTKRENHAGESVSMAEEMVADWLPRMETSQVFRESDGCCCKFFIYLEHRNEVGTINIRSSICHWFITPSPNCISCDNRYFTIGFGIRVTRLCNANLDSLWNRICNTLGHIWHWIQANFSFWWMDTTRNGSDLLDYLQYSVICLSGIRYMLPTKNGTDTIVLVLYRIQAYCWSWNETCN